MGMNPDTRQFEALDSPAALEVAQSKGWKIFRTGEKITLQGIDFTVSDIQPTKLTLRPWGSQDITAESASEAFPVKLNDLLRLSNQIIEHGPDLEISPDAVVKSAAELIDRLHHRKNENLTHHAGIGWAIKEMHHGQKVRRVGWNGKGMFLYLVPPGEYPARTQVAKETWGENGLVPYQAYIAMKTAQDTVVPWLASQTDLLAIDWELA